MRPFRFALPKGRLSEEVIELLHSAEICSLSEVPSGRELIFKEEDSSIEFILVRAKDVGTYVEQGACDMGVMGRDLLLEHNFSVSVPLDLPLGECRLSVAYPQENANWKQKKNLRVATKYPRLATNYLFKLGFNVKIIELYGSIEIAPLTQMSDIIVDLVSTGQTLKANNLTEDDVILHSTAALILNSAAIHTQSERINEIIDRLTAKIL